MSPETPVDILVIGGGINGAGIARDAVGRGFSVCLCDTGDFGGGTSSASTKLIHGGLRYLEHHEFRLVREALRERERLWAIAPHIVKPMRFVLPHVPGMRPAWLLRLGLFVYDHLGGRKRLPATRAVRLAGTELGAPVSPALKRGWEYSDCWVDDARLVILNLRDAAQRGADIRPRTRVTEARWTGALWDIGLCTAAGVSSRLNARVIVNAAGPQVDRVIAEVFGRNDDAQNLRLVRGSHIVVPRLAEHDRAYIFQEGDGRIVFAIPYEEDFTVIGTTDADQGRDASRPVITPEETDYLCAAATRYFRNPVTPDDVVWSFSGLRALVDDGASSAQEATRDYVLKYDPDRPVLHVLGGKITTYRKLAQAALARIAPTLGVRSGLGDGWTGDAPLPGGDFPVDGVEALTGHMAALYPFVPGPVMARMVRAYGTEVAAILGGATWLGDLGQHFGGGLFEAELHYMRDREWARTTDDALFRRSKLGLRLTSDERAAVAGFFAEYR